VRYAARPTSSFQAALDAVDCGLLVLVLVLVLVPVLVPELPPGLVVLEAALSLTTT